MVMARPVVVLKRALRGFCYAFRCYAVRNAGCISCVLILSNAHPALCASTAQVYEIGDEVPGNDENYMWVDRNPYFETAMTLFHIEEAWWFAELICVEPPPVIFRSLVS